MVVQIRTNAKEAEAAPAKAYMTPEYLGSIRKFHVVSHMIRWPPFFVLCCQYLSLLIGITAIKIEVGHRVTERAAPKSTYPQVWLATTALVGYSMNNLASESLGSSILSAHAGVANQVSLGEVLRRRWITGLRCTPQNVAEIEQEHHEPRRFFGAYGFSPPERSERRIGTPMRPKVARRPLTR